MNNIEQICVAMFWEHPGPDQITFQANEHFTHDLAVKATDIMKFPAVPTGVIRIRPVIEGGVFNHLERTICHRYAFQLAASA